MPDRQPTPGIHENFAGALDESGQPAAFHFSTPAPETPSVGHMEGIVIQIRETWAATPEVNGDG